MNGNGLEKPDEAKSQLDIAGQSMMEINRQLRVLGSTSGMPHFAKDSIFAAHNKVVNAVNDLKTAAELIT